MKPLPDLTPEEEAEEDARDAAHIEDCIAGSSRLKDCLLKAFEDFEHKHGLKAGEAKILLCDTGVKR